jgi:ABC-type glycerol-3-phosphate transport system permease component
MVPITVIMNRLRLYDSLSGLILAHLAYTIPFAIYMLRGYFMGIPQELEEAAMVDGCSRFQSFLRITLPLAVPGLVTVAIFSFVMSWGDAVFSIVLLNTQDKYTLPIHIGFFLGEGRVVDPEACCHCFGGWINSCFSLHWHPRFVRWTGSRSGKG